MPDIQPAVRRSDHPAVGPTAPVGAASAGYEQAGGKPAARWRHPGWSWTVGRDWLIPSGVAVTTLLIGAGFGAIGAPTSGRALAYLAIGAAGLVLLILTWIAYRGRERMLRRNGTAYIIYEEAREWSLDDSRDFLAAAGRQFARTIRVPGPGKFGESWDWPLGDGAENWDSKVTELTRSFQALYLATYSDDDPETPKGTFLWAWWAVAVAYGARVTATDRGIALDVWQRPSRGRAGHLEAAPWSQRPHRFGQGGPAHAITEVLPSCVPQELTWPAQVTIIPRQAQPGTGPEDRIGVAILLVRLGLAPWGPLPAVPAVPDPAVPVSLVLDDAAGLGPAGTFPCEIHELRIAPPAGTGLFPWQAYPALVGGVSAWIRRKAATLEGRTVVLGTVMPAEVALGLGIDAGQIGVPGWPAHLWPAIYRQSADSLVVPRLDLGEAGFMRRAGG